MASPVERVTLKSVLEAALGDVITYEDHNAIVRSLKAIARMTFRGRSGNSPAQCNPALDEPNVHLVKVLGHNKDWETTSTQWVAHCADGSTGDFGDGKYFAYAVYTDSLQKTTDTKTKTDSAKTSLGEIELVSDDDNKVPDVLLWDIGIHSEERRLKRGDYVLAMDIGVMIDTTASSETQGPPDVRIMLCMAVTQKVKIQLVDNERVEIPAAKTGPGSPATATEWEYFGKVVNEVSLDIANDVISATDSGDLIHGYNWAEEDNRLEGAGDTWRSGWKYNDMNSATFLGFLQPISGVVEADLHIDGNSDPYFTFREGNVYSGDCK